MSIRPRWGGTIHLSANTVLVFGRYLEEVIPLEDANISPGLVAKLIAAGIIMLVTVIKLLGTNALMTFSSLLLFVSFIPPVLYVCWGFSVQKPITWVRKHHYVQLARFTLLRVRRVSHVYVHAL